MKIFYFTATGNSLQIAKELGGDIYSIPKVIKTDKYSFTADKIGIVFPCHYLVTPVIVRDFLEKVELKSKYIFAIMTYGQFAGNGLRHFIKLANKSGFEISYANEIFMTTNYLPMFDIEEELEKEKSKKIAQQIAQIKEDISNKEEKYIPDNLQGKIMTFTGEILYQLKRWRADRKFNINNNCSNCGLCARVCPVNNIDINDKPIYNNNCHNCLSCINLCPEGSIWLKKEKSVSRYRNINVNIEEIIEANI